MLQFFLGINKIQLYVFIDSPSVVFIDPLKTVSHFFVRHPVQNSSLCDRPRSAQTAAWGMIPGPHICILCMDRTGCEMALMFTSELHI